MTVTAPNANSGIPSVVDDGQYITVPFSGTAHIGNPGDLVIWSGFYAITTGMGAAGAGAKASAVGILMDRNPGYDWAGRQAINSAVLVMRFGVVRVSASFSGRPLLGVLAYPTNTGSGVNAPSGQTGLGATWNTAAPASVSGGTAAAPVPAIGQMINWFDSGPAGTGQMDVVIWNRNADYF
jgi:hypothetical protein